MKTFNPMYCSRYVINISIKIKYDAINVLNQNIMLQTTLKRKVKVKALNQQEVKGQIKVIAVEGQGQGDRGSEWGSHDNRYPLWLPWIQPLICELICMYAWYIDLFKRERVCSKLRKRFFSRNLNLCCMMFFTVNFYKGLVH